MEIIATILFTEVIIMHLKRDGKPVYRDDSIPSTSDIGYKDQNSSIHILEALTELYHVWPEPLVRLRLQEMLSLIRDKMVSKKGYLILFFNRTGHRFLSGILPKLLY